MFGWFGYYHYDTIIKIIDKVQQDRTKRRLKGLTMKSRFHEDLKDYLNGLWVQEPDEKEEEKKDESENLKLNIGNVKEAKNC
mgnify:FL=1|tara:strand:+ start:296 stop:541 length:246 start_codon:yes stop_codon:yes gene_type:complete